METTTVEDDKTIWFHINELQYLPILITFVDVGTLSIGEEWVEDHAILKIFVPFRAVQEFVTEF